jgi:PPM family protein phosphatase
MGAVSVLEIRMFAVSKQIHAGDSGLQDRAEYIWCDSNLVLVVADGAGGLGGGAEAAEFAVHGIKKRVVSTDLNSEALNDLLVSLDREMAVRATFGETTCVIAVLSNNGVIGTSVGDSGSFIFSKAGADNLTANQIRKPFLGSGRAIPISFTRDHFDGTLLLASDGLLKYTSLEKIAATILAADLDVAASKLVDLVRYQSGVLPDDVSVLLARKT